MKHKFNRDFFEEIDSTEKSYFLGWIFCDGNIKGTDSCRLQLHPKDLIVLEKFVNCVEGNKNMIKIEKDFYPTLYLNSRKMVTDLNEYGCIPNKTHVLIPPTLKEDYYNSFWRGCWEADGSISIVDKRYSEKAAGYTANLSFNGTEDMCNGFKNYMGWDLKTYSANRQTQTRRVARTLTYWNKAQLDYQKLYDESDLFLPRKKEVFENFLQTREYYEKEEYYKRGRNG